MDRSERFAIIERLLRSRRTVSFAELQERLEVSRPTLYRDLAYLRDRMGVPLIRDEATGNLASTRRPSATSCPACGFPPRKSTPC